MKKTILPIIFQLVICAAAHSQTLRYFEFSVCNRFGNASTWQDTSFIAATSNQKVIDSVLANMARPINKRWFIIGKIDNGNGGVNHNATHWFKWHFVPSAWNLTQIATEVCDGCPYTAVDKDTEYWVNTVKYYCPYSSKPIKEVFPIATGTNEPSLENTIKVFPNPAKDRLFVAWQNSNSISATIHNPVGQKLRSYQFDGTDAIIEVNDLPLGCYTLHVSNGNSITTKQFVVER